MGELIRRYYRPIDIQRFEFVLKLCLGKSGSVKRILDVGAWDKLFKEMLESHGFEAIAVDIDPHSSGLLKADVMSLPFKNSTFDLTTALEVIEHFDKKEMVVAIEELERVTKKIVIVSVPNQEAPLGEGHKQYFDDTKIKKIVKYKNVRIHHLGKRLAYQGVRKYLCCIHPVLLRAYNKIFGERKKEIDNWIITIFQLDK